MSNKKLVRTESEEQAIINAMTKSVKQLKRSQVEFDGEQEQMGTEKPLQYRLYSTARKRAALKTVKKMGENCC